MTILLVIGLLVGGVKVADADSDQASEYDLKVAYLFNFLEFVELPGNPARDSQPNFHVCVRNGDKRRTAFDSLKSESVKGKPLAVVYNVALADIAKCHVVYFSSDGESSTDPLLSQIAKKGILTVGESANFCAQGGIMNFFFEDKKLKFEVSLKSAEREEIKLPAKLLKHARVLEN